MRGGEVVPRRTHQDEQHRLVHPPELSAILAIRFRLLIERLLKVLVNLVEGIQDAVRILERQRGQACECRTGKTAARSPNSNIQSLDLT